jgi:hypothetical protein
MGREVRRVPLDFDWPQGETWSGYVMPESLEEKTCGDCVNGSTAARAWVEHMAHLCLMLDDDRRSQAMGRPLHPYLQDIGHYSRDGRPSADIAEFGTGLAGREGGPVGHDAIDRWRATEKLITAAGLDPDVWGICPTCAGHGSVEVYPGQRAEAEAWEPSDPPTGDGWQMWQTTSEGSPMSPVFATPEELARWLAVTGASMFGSTTASYEQWLKIVKGEDFAHVEIAPGVVMM